MSKENTPQGYRSKLQKNLHALGLDVGYIREEGDLFYRKTARGETQVLDLTDSFGYELGQFKEERSY